MSKSNRMTRLTPAACAEIQVHMLEACQKILADHGLVIESAGWRGLDTGFAFEPVFLRGKLSVLLLQSRHLFRFLPVLLNDCHIVLGLTQLLGDLVARATRLG